VVGSLSKTSVAMAAGACSQFANLVAAALVSPHAPILDASFPGHATADACRHCHRCDATSDEAALVARSVCPKSAVICQCSDCYCCRAHIRRDARHCLGHRAVSAYADLPDQPPRRSSARPASRHRGVSRRSAPSRGDMKKLPETPGMPSRCGTWPTMVT
jgi:hypothetical protein